MDLIAELAKHNKKIEDITKVYKGRDHECRCGCKGKYYDAGTPGFKRAMKAIQATSFTPVAFNTKMWHGLTSWESDGVSFHGTYMNIPYDADKDKCYCLYFD